MHKATDSMWTYIKKYRWNSLFVKYLLILLIVTTCLFSIIIFFANNTISGSVKKELEERTLTSVIEDGNALEDVFSSVNSLHTFVNSIDAVFNFVNVKMETMTTADIMKMTNDINKLLGAYVTANDYIYSIDIYSPVQNSFYSINTFGDYTSPLYDVATSIYGSQKAQTIFPSTVKTISRGYEQEVISVCKELWYNNTRAGLLIVNLDTDYILDMLNTADAKRVVVADPEGHIILDSNAGSSSNASIVPDDEFSEAFRATPSPDSPITLRGEVYSYSLSWPRDFVLLQKIHIETEGISEYVIAQKRLMVLVSIGSILAIIVLTCIITLYFYRKIYVVIKALDASAYASNHHLDEKDELKYITTIINKTIHDNATREAELNIRLQYLEKAQLIALQAQINPHFVANTLQVANGIILAAFKQDNNATLILSNLADLFRSTLKTDEYLVPLKDEIKYIEKYFFIQNVRYSGRLTLNLNLDPDTLNHEVVKLSLQPIVENAIAHGIIPTEGKGSVSISSRISQDYLIITVHNTGVCIEKEKLLEIQNNMAENTTIRESRHLGLSNVNQRYQLVFGSKSGLFIDSSEEGTVVTIKIPITKN